MAFDAVALVVPLFVMVTGVEIGHQKNMYARITYSMSETYDTKHLAQVWFEATGDWPTTKAEFSFEILEESQRGAD